MRKIIYFETLNGSDECGLCTVIALCDDGTLWTTAADFRLNVPWKRITDIPQDDIKTVAPEMHAGSFGTPVKGRYRKITKIYGPEDGGDESGLHSELSHLIWNRQYILYFNNPDFYTVGETVDVYAPNTPLSTLLTVLCEPKSNPYRISDVWGKTYSYIATLEFVEC